MYLNALMLQQIDPKINLLLLILENVFFRILLSCRKTRFSCKALNYLAYLTRIHILLIWCWTYSVLLDQRFWSIPGSPKTNPPKIEKVFKGATDCSRPFTQMLETIQMKVKLSKTYDATNLINVLKRLFKLFCKV